MAILINLMLSDQKLNKLISHNSNQFKNYLDVYLYDIYFRRTNIGVRMKLRFF